MPADPAQNDPAILAEIRTFVATWFRDGREDGLGIDTPLVTSGIVDSAGVVEVVEFLERRFGVRLDDADVSLRNCNTLRGLCELVQRRRAS
ncbi:MAG: acyl carrier protein [Planctomycetes bacterium]|nr:acyl carrier protein [Planctomycetota bacterium]